MLFLHRWQDVRSACVKPKKTTTKDTKYTKSYNSKTIVYVLALVRVFSAFRGKRLFD
jgi:hypothetical protein